jgi:uncharacterized membrane protein YdjX (TVP38/TMEM64 family)
MRIAALGKKVKLTLIPLRVFQTNRMRLLLIILLVAGIATFFISGGYDFFRFENLTSHKDELIQQAEEHPLLAPVVYTAAYLVLGLLGLPGSTVLNLTAGALFDFWKGLLWVVFASNLASTLAFFSFRYLFRDYVETKARQKFPKLVEDLEKGGIYFVFALRLFPVIPFSVTNLVLAISPVSFLVYFSMTLLALLPRHLLYVYAGLYLGDIQDPDDLLSPPLIGALALLAVLPWILKGVVPKIHQRITQNSQKR